jgi:hypothetical protein
LVFLLPFSSQTHQKHQFSLSLSLRPFMPTLTGNGQFKLLVFVFWVILSMPVGEGIKGFRVSPVMFLREFQKIRPCEVGICSWIFSVDQASWRSDHLVHPRA